MEPLSATASIITLLQLAHKISILCFDLHSSVKNARHDVSLILDETHDLRDVLEKLARLAPSRNQHPGSGLFDIDILMRPDGPITRCTAELESLANDLQKMMPSKSKPNTKSILWAFKEKDVARRLDRIARLKNTLQLALAVDQTSLLVESNLNLKSLRSTIDNSAIESQRRAIVEWLGQPFASNHIDDLQKIRSPSTGEWFLRSETFRHWISSPHSLLWLHGIPGCGKSVLSSSIVEELYEQRATDVDILVVHYFFDFSTKDSQTVGIFLRSLLAQITIRTHDLKEPIHSLYARHYDGFQQPTEKALLATLRAVLGICGQTYLVMDAMDECKNRVDLLDAITTMVDWKLPTLHMLATSRREKDIEDVFNALRSQKFRLGEKHISADILQYVHRTVRREPRFRKWSEEIHAEIANTVAGHAGGMFRWASCQLDTLKKCTNLKALLDALNSLPPTLDDTYARILESIDPDSVDDVLKILSWLCFAFRPPSMLEMVEILAIDLDTLEYDPARKMQDPQDVLLLCGSLVTMSSELGGVLKLAHQSVKDYLVSGRILQGKNAHFHVKERAADAFVAKTCLIYLRQCDYWWEESQTTAGHARQPLREYCLQFWAEHFLRAREPPELLALALDLISRPQSKFLDWASLNALVPYGLYSEDPLPESFARDDILLYYSTLVGSPRLIETMLNGGADVNAHGGIYGTALAVAAYKGDTQSIKLLLDRGARTDIASITHGTALHIAAATGWLEVVTLLVSHGADIDVDIEYRGSVLQCAAYRGNMQIVEFLLAQGANVNIHGGQLDTALNGVILSGDCFQHALRLGKSDIAKALISKGAKVNATGGPFGSPLNAAAIRGLLMLRFLIDWNGADPAWRDSEGRTALQVASCSCQVSAVTYLLELGLDVNDEDLKGWSAIHYAALTSSAHCLKVVLLQCKPHCLSSTTKWTPLHLACCRNGPEALDLLLEAGFQPSTVTTLEPEHQWTLYDIAYAFGNRQLVSNDGEALHTSLLLPSTSRESSPAPLSSLEPTEKEFATVWIYFACNGCEQAIHGPRFRCEQCHDFDYCFMCNLTADKSHPHSLTKVSDPDSDSDSESLKSFPGDLYDGPYEGKFACLDVRSVLSRW